MWEATLTKGGDMSLFSKPEPETIEIGDRPLTCLVCGFDRFDKREGQLNTAGLSFLGLDWANESAVCVICQNCGFIHWFRNS